MFGARRRTIRIEESVPRKASLFGTNVRIGEEQDVGNEEEFYRPTFCLKGIRKETK